jgi:hypothetical protein
MANFWTDGRIEPKRQNRWVIQFDGIYNGNMYFATKVGRPSIEVTSKQHKYLNHIFNYPGRPEWKPITLTMVDTAGGAVGDLANGGTDTMKSLLQVLTDNGYIVPSNEGSLGTISKAKAVDSLSSGARGGTGTTSGAANGVTITMVNAEGLQVEKWTLKNAFITKYTPSELSYEDDGIATVDIEIVYDYCVFNEGSDNLFTPR